MTKLNQEQHEQIKAVFKKTGSIKATAKQTGFSRNAVRRHLRGFSKVPNYKKRASKLDPYKAKINHLVKEKLLSAVRVLEEIRELGYEGGYSILKNYIRLIRPKPLKRPTPPIFHPPGHESQMDWSPHNVIIGGREQIVHTGSIVVCFSRWLFFRHFLDETIESVIALHKEAFSELGYVTEIITYDNMTTVGRHIGPGKVWINPRFKRFADEYGFTVVILPPGKKERHGKVERPFHYIENNFLAGREFKDMEDLNHRADKWRSHTANVRIHGTLRERPVDRLKREIPYLKPLPQLLSASFYKEVDRLLHSDFCVSINTNRYSANPERIGQYTKVRLYNDHLEIWIDDKFDCRHSYAKGRYERNVLPEHEALYKQITNQRRLFESAFLKLGEPAKIYYEGLQRERKAATGYHLKRILQYADRHGADVVAGALAYAAKYGAYSADTVLRIIQGKKLKKQTHSSNRAMPENVRQFLRSYAVEKQMPNFYDNLLENKKEDQ